MQNVVNYICPFFRNGSPIVNGRVYFVKPDTTAQTFSDVVNLDSADFIAIKDKNGTLLENPLPLNSEGRFSIQPFVDDGLDFKMIVCYPTGVPAELHDESMTYDVAYTINSFAQQGEILSIGGVATVDSIAALRQLEPTVKAVLVRGFGAAGDFCPPRLFNWVPSIMTDNNGTKIRSSVQGYTNTGTWVCTPSGFVDVRWFGIDPESGIDYTSVILAIAQEFTGMAVYFPYGSYYLSSHVSFKSVILERLAIFYPVDNASTDLCFSVENVFENRGGRFDSNGTHCVYPKVKGVLRTSWLSSPMDSALASSVLSSVDEIIFDDTKTVSVAVTISNRRILVKKGVTVDPAISFAPSCSVYYEADGKHMVGPLIVRGDDTTIIKALHEGQDIAELTKDYFAILVDVLFNKLLLDSANYWGAVEDAQDSWYQQKALIANRIRAGMVAVTDLIANNGVMDNIVINRKARYKDGCAVYVGYNNGWELSFLQGSFEPVPLVSRTVHVRDIYQNYPDTSVITIIVHRVIDGITVMLPNVDKDTTIIIYNHGNTAVNIGEEDDLNTNTSVVKILGKVDFNDFGAPDLMRMSASKIVVRAPTASERTTYGIDSTVHWIIDPFAF